LKKLKIVHSADWHISRNGEKREESARCVLAMVGHARLDPPDLFVLAGDLVDELDGRIMLDSDAARCAIDLVELCASIAPVVIVRGTKSHDREAPVIFRHLRTTYPVHVSTQVEQIALVENSSGAKSFVPVGAVGTSEELLWALAYLTMVPSLDKSYLASTYSDSVSAGNTRYRELLHDLLAGLGVVNDALDPDIPRMLVGHGMLTGAMFSTGQVAIGEDMEFSINDLQQARCDAYCLGHVHKFQQHAGNICYSGSPGRLNFGEVEEKGFLEWRFIGRALQHLEFVPLPARKFCFVDVKWDATVEGVEHVEQALVAALPNAAGADVRFRFDVPEELRQLVDRPGIEQAFLDAGALRVKVEMQIIPKQRQRAAGISGLTTLPAKVKKWGEATDTEIPASVLELAGAIEGMSVEELLTMALAPPVPAAALGDDVFAADRDGTAVYGVVHGRAEVSLADGEVLAPGALNVDSFTAAGEQANLF